MKTKNKNDIEDTGAIGLGSIMYDPKKDIWYKIKVVDEGEVCATKISARKAMCFIISMFETLEAKHDKLEADCQSMKVPSSNNDIDG